MISNVRRRIEEDDSLFHTTGGRFLANHIAEHADSDLR